MKRLSLGSSLLFGGVNPVTTIKWLGGHLSLIAAANRSPSIDGFVGVERCNDPVSAALQNRTQIFAN
jgi:hypothetical protein